ncbi:MAG: hypothetical protein QM698_16555 [Micropepsaceae bacterium]
MSALFTALPAPVDLGWTPRPVSSADIVVTPLGDGRLEVRIDHAPLTGITTAMLGWWFQTFDSIVTWRGHTMPAYRLWHTADHIDVRPRRSADGRIAPGCRLNIREVFGRDPRFAADIRAVIHRWDSRGIGFHHDVLGHRVVELDHAFTDSPSGVLYRTCMRAGVGNGPLRSLINRLAVKRRFGPEAVTAWTRHNIEEVGFFTDFLPELYAAQAIAPRASTNAP